MRERNVRLPAGEWIDLWRSADVTADGEIVPRRAVVLPGGRAHMVPAPLHEIPVLVRAGARIPLLPATVRSLYRGLPTDRVILTWNPEI